jgi:hypothetical protein
MAPTAIPLRSMLNTHEKPYKDGQSTSKRLGSVCCFQKHKIHILLTDRDIGIAQHSTATMLSRLFVWLVATLLVALAQASGPLVAHRQPLVREAVARQNKARALSVAHIHRRLAEISLEKRDQVFSNSTSLDKSFEGVTLLKISGEATKNLNQEQANPKEEVVGVTAGIEIVCARCYTKGNAKATLELETDFNATQAIEGIEQAVSNTLEQIEEWVDGIEFDFGEFELDIPSPNITFDIDLDIFPGAMIEFQFDGVEMYVELDVTLGAGLSYRLNLYKSHELGIELAADLFMGLVFSVDLLLNVDTEVTINSGFHLLLDDGILLRLAMFAKETSKVDFNGGTFEFLPVTVKTSGVVLTGIIQLSLRAGFSLSTPDITPGFNIELGDAFNLDELTKASAGIEARVYANVAVLSTNVTADLTEDAECALPVVQEYAFAVGVAAGATAGLGGHVWGPVGAAATAVFATTLATACARDGSKVTANPAAARMLAREPQDGDAELTTTTLERENTYSATLCRSTGLADCPASLVTVEEIIATETLVTAVPSGAEATFPETTQLQVLSTVGFGTNAKSMVSETAKPDDKDKDGNDGNDGDSFFDKKTGGVDNKLIIGLSVGLGVPLILAVIAGVIFCQRRRAGHRYDRPPVTTVEQTSTSYMGGGWKPQQPTQVVRPIYNN